MYHKATNKRMRRNSGRHNDLKRKMKNASREWVNRHEKCIFQEWSEHMDFVIFN